MTDSIDVDKERDDSTAENSAPLDTIAVLSARDAGLI